MRTEQLRAALQMLYPEEITPTARNVLERIADQWDHDDAR